MQIFDLLMLLRAVQQCVFIMVSNTLILLRITDKNERFWTLFKVVLDLPMEELWSKYLLRRSFVISSFSKFLAATSVLSTMQPWLAISGSINKIIESKKVWLLAKLFHIFSAIFLFPRQFSKLLCRIELGKYLGALQQNKLTIVNNFDLYYCFYKSQEWH